MNVLAFRVIVIAGGETVSPKRWSTRRAFILLVVVAISLSFSGCFCSSDFEETGHADRKDDNTQVRCACEWTLKDTDECRPCKGPFCVPEKTNATFDLCLPPELNTALDGGALDKTDPQWVEEVGDYCRVKFPETAKRLHAYLSKRNCEQNCLARVECVLEEIEDDLAVAPNPTCGLPCEEVECGYNTNCNPDEVADLFGVNPEKCKCTVIPPQPWSASCGAGTRSEVFCTMPPGNQDPPTNASGLLTSLLSAPNTILLDHDRSYVDITIGFSDGLGIGHTDTRKTHARGSVILHGLCEPNTACNAQLELTVDPAPTTFHFSKVVCGPTCLEDIDVTASAVKLTGGTWDVRVPIGPDGFGRIPLNALRFRAEATTSGIPGEPVKRRRVDAANDRPIDFAVDFANKTFTMSGVPFTFPDGSATLTLTGPITNQPPRARAGLSQTVECASSIGSPVVLDATASSDPDQNIAGFEWWTPHALTGGTNIASGSQVSITAPFIPPALTTRYELAVFDQRLVTTVSPTSVTVQDTTPPDLEVVLDPECLWSPNHKLVLFEPGNGISFLARDACDSAVTTRIVDVKSTQPVLGAGSGATSPDVVFGSGAFCARAERAGTIQEPRQYLVTVEARDSSGNVATKQATVRVRHDQGTDPRCTKVPTDRLVDESDPRCVADAPVPAKPMSVPRPDQVVPVEPRSVPVVPPLAGRTSPVNGGCSLAHESPSYGSGVLGVVLVISVTMLRRSRRSERLLAVSLCIVATGFMLSSCGRDISPALDQRVTGWWVDPQPGGCYCPQQAECSAGDCVGHAVIGLLPDKRYYDGRIAVSKKNGTMSTMGALARGTYRVDGNTVVISQAGIPEATFAVNFDGERMHLGARVETRAPGEMARTLDSATTGDIVSWSAMPFER